MDQSPQQKKFEIQDRRRIVAERYLRGQTQWQIARSLEVTQSTISDDIKAIRKEWRDAYLKDYEQLKDRELAKIDLMEREYLEAWERSKKERQYSRTRKRVARTGNADEAEVRKEQRDGNPKFMDGTLRCVEMRCRLLGMLDKKKEESPPPGGPPTADGPLCLTLEE